MPGPCVDIVDNICIEPAKVVDTPRVEKPTENNGSKDTFITVEKPKIEIVVEGGPTPITRTVPTK